MQEEAKKIKGAERFIKKQNFKNDFKEARQFHSEQRKERHEEKDREMEEYRKEKRMRKEMGYEAFK